MITFWQKVSGYLSRYPAELSDLLHLPGRVSSLPAGAVAGRTIAIQSVADKFYFLLFGAIAKRLGLKADLVVVRSINGATGTGWQAGIKRSAPFARLATGPWIRAYGSDIRKIAYRCSTWADPMADVLDWIKAGKLWHDVKSASGDSPCLLTIGGIEVGDLIVSSYLRYKPSPTFLCDDPFVRTLIWQACRDVRRTQRYFSSTQPAAYLSSYTTYIEHGVSARVALACGVPVWAFGNLNQFGKRLTASDPYQTADTSSYRSTFECLDRKDERLSLALTQLERRLSGGIDPATSYMRQSAYSAANAPLPDGLHGAVVIFLHDFFDSPHVYSDLVFDDFWQWIYFTIAELKNIGVKFFLKPHPNQINLSDQAIQTLRQENPDIDWLPANITNVQLVDAGISCGITVYGTVAHELAFLGVPTICCAKHPHHAFDFSRTARSRHEYAELLKTHSKKPLGFEEMRRQALIFYYMHNLFGIGNLFNLKQAFVDLWRLCNMGDNNPAAIESAFNRLIREPGFDDFVITLSQQTNSLDLSNH